MRIKSLFVVLIMSGLAASAVFAQAPAPQGAQGDRRVASVNTAPRVDVTDMPRPIDMHDSVWIEDLTMLEENGKKIVAFRTEATVAAIKKSIGK